jgi:hypothetical protein
MHIRRIIVAAIAAVTVAAGAAIAASVPASAQWPPPCPLGTNWENGICR